MSLRNSKRSSQKHNPLSRTAFAKVKKEGQPEVILERIHLRVMKYSYLLLIIKFFGAPAENPYCGTRHTLERHMGAVRTVRDPEDIALGKYNLGGSSTYFFLIAEMKLDRSISGENKRSTGVRVSKITFLSPS